MDLKNYAKFQNGVSSPSINFLNFFYVIRNNLSYYAYYIHSHISYISYICIILYFQKKLHIKVY